ncbi:Na+/H+ antiporter subunit D [Isoalcanivorax indicus]|uniref:Na+/H+ antiporter subunit D n=1 Tax=Isoalcanivorax indicus TaxID=2202653 RepID=UPI000DBA8D29|nr:Na+/H+ antiporter subunit D [Isoalcanivorax indicus]
MQSPTLLALPIVIPLLAGALSLIYWRSRKAQRIIGVLGSTGLLIASGFLLEKIWREGTLVMHMGNWHAPFGIVLVGDMLAAFMVVMTGVSAVTTAFYALGSVSKQHEHFGFYPLMHLLLAGVNGAFLTGDVFNLYVWFEVMLVASFALLILGGERAQMEGAIKYVTLNLVSSAMFLSAIGLLYGLMGTLNMADIAMKIGELEDTAMITVVSMLFLMAFGIKAAAFPLFFWLPASYHTPRVAVSALFAGLLTKVGVYALFRFFTLIFPFEGTLSQSLMVWIAGLTMVTGVLGAAAQFEFRRILSFHIVSQIGYMLMGLALFTPLALAGGIYFIAHNIVAKSGLFLISGLVFRFKGSYELKELGGVYRQYPMLALLFLICAFSLAGLPPLSGFFAKFMVIRAGVEEYAWWLVATALAVGFMTLYSMVKIWAEVFWKEQEVCHIKPPRKFRGGTRVMYATVVMLAGLTIFMGLAMEPLFRMSMMAAEQLLDRNGYIEAVLGVTP